MERVVINVLNEVRNTHGMTQEALAEKVGVSRQTIIAIEKGKYTPSVSLALRLAHAFSMRVEDLFSLSKS
ncbi:helix-turn-helix transcriptional regulator [Patescibacteria group bacterium]|nr:helix-turn-helix transcriptional regulator [Patescibacteria group bacterium]